MYSKLTGLLKVDFKERTHLDEILFNVENLQSKIKNNLILSDISCQIPAKQVTTIIGSSGAGKSTFLRTLVRLIEFSGTISFHNQVLKDIDVKELRKKACYVPQIPEIFPGTVEENITWARSIWKMSISKEFVENLLKTVDLDPSLISKNASDLSVGQKQRVCLARSLALEPDVLLLDEPDSALDAISKENFEKSIANLKTFNPNLSIIMVTHDLRQANRMADYVILLHKGKFIAQGSAENIFATIDSYSESDFLKSLINGKNGGN